jgi:hypothetical protein
MRKIMGNHWTQENEWDTGPRIVIKDANYCECQYLIAMKWCMGRCLMRRQVGQRNIPANCTETLVCRSFPFKVGEPLGCGAQDPEEASGRKSARHRGFSSWEASKEVLCGPDRSQMIFTDSQAIPVLVDQVRVQQCSRQHASAISMIKPWVLKVVPKVASQVGLQLIVKLDQET